MGERSQEAKEAQEGPGLTRRTRSTRHAEVVGEPNPLRRMRRMVSAAPTRAAPSSR